MDLSVYVKKLILREDGKKRRDYLLYCKKNHLDGEVFKLKTAVVIRHVAYEGLGLFTRVLEHSGYDIIYLDAGSVSCRQTIATEADILIVLGGPVSINDRVKFPYLIDELKLIEYRLKNKLPALGIGLGAQMLAKALGALVYPMPDHEYGWAPIRLMTESGLLEPFRNKHILHWHNNSFALPNGAKLLASTSKCEVQSFSWEQSLALQFHAEVDMRKFEQWILGHAIEIQRADRSCLSQLREGAESYGVPLETHASQVMYNWLLSLSN